MIFRVALFITLLAIFYNYCKEESNTNQFRGPNDINKIEVPNEFSPTFMDYSNTAVNLTMDSSGHNISDYFQLNYSEFGINNPLPKNY